MTKQERREAQESQGRIDRVNARIVKIQERLDVATAVGNNDKIVKRTARLAKAVALKAQLEA